MLLLIHSAIRYLVLVLGVAALGYALYGALGGRPYDVRMRKLSAAFAGSIHLQILVGVAFLFTRQFYPQLAGHLFMMIFAAVAAQIVPSVMRRRPEEKRTWWPHVVGTLVALALIWGGLAAIQRPLIGGVAL